MEKIPEIKIIGKNIAFCPKCNWKEIDDEETRKCPKCKTWVWNVYQYKYLNGKEIVGQEAGLTDNDESFVQAQTLKELKRIFDKAIGVSLYGFRKKESRKR